MDNLKPNKNIDYYLFTLNLNLVIEKFQLQDVCL